MTVYKCFSVSPHAFAYKHNFTFSKKTITINYKSLGLSTENEGRKIIFICQTTRQE